MEIREYSLSETIDVLAGPTKEQIIVFNQWAATALDRYHLNSTAQIEFVIDNETFIVPLKWDSSFSKDAMKEKRKMAEEGGVSLAMFIMAVVKGYKYLQQTEIGEGVDYRFMKNQPDPINFLNHCHYIEVSGILEEAKSNTLKERIKIKHAQIKRGSKNSEESSVIITLFNKPSAIKEIHQ